MVTYDMAGEAVNVHDWEGVQVEDFGEWEINPDRTIWCCEVFVLANGLSQKGMFTVWFNEQDKLVKTDFTIDKA